uniref:Uncharacterized protein n=1 Tax=Wuchereria bancrofti TaxID=6293 RepID=A0AAF5RTE2_WUCBA
MVYYHNEIFINEEGMEIVYNEPSLEEDSFVRYFNETMKNVTCRAKKPLIDEAPAGIWKIMIFRCFDGAAIKLPANYQMNDSSSIGSEDMTNSAMDISVDENSSHHSSSSICCFTIPEDIISVSSYLLHTSLNTNDIYEHQMTASGYMVYSDTNSELDSMSFESTFSSSYFKNIEEIS